MRLPLSFAGIIQILMVMYPAAAQGPNEHGSASALARSPD